MSPYFAIVVRENDIYTVNTFHSKIITQNDSDVDGQTGHSELSRIEMGR